MFAGDLCLALGCTLSTVEAMSAAEFSFWNIYYTRRGFPVNRLEGATAIAGSAVCRSLGGKVEPKELLPKFGARRVSNKVLAARLSMLPGAKVRRIERPGRKPNRAGGRAEPAADGEGREVTSRVLNPRKKRKR